MTKMTIQESIMSSIQELFQGYTLISISGKAGTGKTSMSLFLIGKFLTSIQPYEGSCIWVQASELFSKKRLHSLFERDNDQLTYLTQNFFVTPGYGPFTSYDVQLQGLKRLSEDSYFLPPDVKFMVIDNISHHLRYKLSRIADPEMRSKIINEFYDTVLTPLMFRCHRDGIKLVLIHEVSFNVGAQQTRPFFSKLYERIRGVHMILSQSFETKQRVLKVGFNESHYSIKFQLADNGFYFST